MTAFNEMNKILKPAICPGGDHPLTNRLWKDLYHAVNLLMMEFGANGQVTTDSENAGKVMGALFEIDDGVYKEDF